MRYLVKDTRSGKEFAYRQKHCRLPAGGAVRVIAFATFFALVPPTANPSGLAVLPSSSQNQPAHRGNSQDSTYGNIASVKEHSSKNENLASEAFSLIREAVLQELRAGNIFDNEYSPKKVEISQNLRNKVRAALASKEAYAVLNDDLKASHFNTSKFNSIPSVKGEISIFMPYASGDFLVCLNGERFLVLSPFELQTLSDWKKAADAINQRGGFQFTAVKFQLLSTEIARMVRLKRLAVRLNPYSGIYYDEKAFMEGDPLSRCKLKKRGIDCLIGFCHQLGGATQEDLLRVLRYMDGMPLFQGLNVERWWNEKITPTQEELLALENDAKRAKKEAAARESKERIGRFLKKALAPIEHIYISMKRAGASDFKANMVGLAVLISPFVFFYGLYRLVRGLRKASTTNKNDGRHTNTAIRGISKLLFS